MGFPSRQLAAIPADQRKVQIFCGFLQALRSKCPELAETLLDKAVESETLGPWYPILQTAAGVDEKGLDRLIHSLNLGKAPLWIYRNLGGGRATDPISGNDFRRLIKQITAREDGVDVACDILSMRLYSEKDRPEGYDPDIVDAGRGLIRQIEFTNQHAREDYHIGQIAKVCLSGAEGALVAEETCRRLKESILKYQTSAFYHDDFLLNLFSVQPIAALDGLFAGNAGESEFCVRLQNSFQSEMKNPFDALPADKLLAWCDKDPQNRYPTIAGLITISERNQETGPRKLTPIALRLLERSPDRVEVLKQFGHQFMPSGWTGSLAATIESNAKLLDELATYPDSHVVDFVVSEQVRLRKFVENERQRENAEDRARDERFE
jgi:hypothetical protein